MTTTITLKNWIKAHESFKSHPYLDTAGKITIGFGRNIEDNGISKQEADFLFDNDLTECLRNLTQFKWYTDQPKSVQFALTNMCFNLGLSRLLGFKKMIAALEKKDYTKAALEALNSHWAKQVGKRAQDIAVLIKEGAPNFDLVI